MSTANERIRDAMIRHQIGVIRASGTLERKMIALLRRTERELKRRINKRLKGIKERGVDLGPQTTTRLLDLEAEIRDILKIPQREISAEITAFLTDLARREPVFIKSVIAEELPIIINFGLPPAKQLREIVRDQPVDGRLLGDWIKEFHEDDIILGGIGRYGVLMMGLADQPPADEEAVPVAGGDDVLYLQPFSEEQAIISTLDEDPGSERFGLPNRYDLRIRIPTTTSDRSRNISVHHSRVIHFAEGSLDADADAEGQPRLRPVFNLLDDLLKIVGSSAETYWQARRAIHAKNDPKAKPMSGEDRTKLKEQVDEYMNDLRQFIGTDGVDLNTIAASVADPQGPFEVVMSLISATSEIPKRILIGSERGQLASEQDERAWANRIDERQQQYAEPLILRPLIDRFIDLGALPEPQDGEYTIRWQSLSDPGEKEQAETALIWGRAAQSFQAANRIISPEEARERFLDMDANAPEVEEEVVQTAVPEPSGSEVPATSQPETA